MISIATLSVGSVDREATDAACTGAHVCPLCAGVSPRLGGVVEAFPERCHHCLFLVREVAEKQFAYECCVTGRGGGEVVAAVFCYRRVCAASVVVVAVTLNKASALEPVDETAYPTAGEEALARDFGDSQPSLDVEEQSEEDFVFGSADARVATQVILQQPGQPAVRRDEATPSFCFRLCEERVHVSPSSGRNGAVKHRDGGWPALVSGPRPQGVAYANVHDTSCVRTHLVYGVTEVSHFGAGEGTTLMTTLAEINQRPAAEKWFFYGLLFWIFTQLSRIVAIPLLQAIIDETDPDAWFYPAVLDLVAVVFALPLMAALIWRRGLLSWLFAIIYLTVSIVDHLGNLVTTALVGPPPTLAEMSSMPAEVVPTFQTIFDVLFLVLLIVPRFRKLFFLLDGETDSNRTSDETTPQPNHP